MDHGLPALVDRYLSAFVAIQHRGALPMIEWKSSDVNNLRVLSGLPVSAVK